MSELYSTEHKAILNRPKELARTHAKLVRTWAADGLHSELMMCSFKSLSSAIEVLPDAG